MIVGDLLFSFSVIGIRCLVVVVIILWLMVVEFVNSRWFNGSDDIVVVIFVLFCIIVI